MTGSQLVNRMDWKHLPEVQRQQLLDLVVEMAYQAWKGGQHTEVKTNGKQLPQNSVHQRKNTQSSP